uniref:Synaptobrevin, longin-like domain protein n=1 Tax=Tanacetum cinerariifolium TaxID=118510 RepID=A0A6L2LSN4_TANCI|nr:hypothetical protein [Tanacetum cinerariifolium]
MTQTFIDTHNMVAYLSKSDRTVAVKSSNDITRLQAIVDKKRVVVTEAAIKDALHLVDAEGVDCLPNEEIFTELARMGYEKPTTKLTFYKAFFSSQWKFLIHIILQSMSAKRTSWNEFSSTMNQLGDLSTHSTKYISPALTQKVFANMRRVGKGCSGVETPLFEGMIAAREPKNHDQSIQSPTPLTPPPQQLKIYHQHYKSIHSITHSTYSTTTTTQDIPSTLQVQSPLPQQQSPPLAQPQGAYFPMSLLQEALDACVALTRHVEHLEHDKVAQDLEILKLKTRMKKLREVNRAKDVVKEIEEVREYSADTQVEGRQADIYHIDIDHTVKVLTMQEDESEVHEAVEVSTTAKLITGVVAAVSETVSVAAVIPSAVPETISAAVIPTVTAPSITVAAPIKAVVPSTRQKRGVVIKDPEEESSAKNPTETTSKDMGKGILVEEPKSMKKKQQVELDETYARKLQEEFNQDIDWEAEIDHVKQRAKEEPFIQRYQNTAGFTLDFFKGMSYDDIRPIFVAKFNANIEFLLKSKEHIEEEESRAIASINETPAQKAAKRRKLTEEAKEAESIKQHLQIVPDEDDDVFTKATSLARNVSVVDYQKIPTHEVYTGTNAKCS